MKSPGLPDIAAIERHIDQLRLGTSLRGVEGTVEGVLSIDGESVILRISGTESCVTLGPITAKVQWSPEKGRSHPLTRAEKSAFRGLRRRPDGERVEVIGPIVRSADAQTCSLQVRRFKVLKNTRL